jgi:biopolymer transport protein ExbB/TolQ
LIKDWKTNRVFLIVAGIGSSLFLIAFMTIVLTRGSSLAKLLIDFQESGDAAVFPYPFTLQNLMWVMLGVAIGDAIYRNACINKERGAISLGLLPEGQNSILTKENMPEVMEKAYLYHIKNDYFLAKLIHTTGMSFQTHASSEQAHEVMSSSVDIELHRLDLKYTLLRYIAWLLPTLGFIGTVVGISASLASIDIDQKHSSRMEQVDNKKTGYSSEKEMAKKTSVSEAVTGRLGLAFNTTILALFQSIIVVLLSQFLQKKEEILVNIESEYCLNNLIVRLYDPDKN